MFQDIFLIGGVANLSNFVIAEYRNAFALVLDCISLFDVNGEILSLFVEASARDIG